MYLWSGSRDSDDDTTVREAGNTEAAKVDEEDVKAEGECEAETPMSPVSNIAIECFKNDKVFQLVRRHVQVCDEVDAREDSGTRVTAGIKKLQQRNLAKLQDLAKRTPGLILVGLLVQYVRLQHAARPIGIAKPSMRS